MDAYLHDYAVARMEELVPGGAFVTAMDGETDTVNHQFAKLYVPLERAVVSMIEDELLPPSVRTSFFIQTASFSEARCMKVLDGIDRLQDVHTTLLPVPCPYYLKWKDGAITTAEFGSEVARAILACFKKRLGECCVPEYMNNDRFEELMEGGDGSCLERIERVCAKDPAGFNTSGITCFLHWQKVDTPQAA